MRYHSSDRCKASLPSTRQAQLPGATEPLGLRQVRLISPQLLILQFHGLGSESPIHPGRQYRQPEDDKGDSDNSGGA